MSRPSARRGGPWRRAAGVVGRAAFVLGLVTVILAGTGLMERLFYQPTAELTPVPPEFPRGEAVWFASADGTRLRGWFLPADGVEAADAPTVVHVHGNAGSIASHIAFTEFLPAAGVNLFLFDYRGYGESEGSARRRDDLIADAVAAVDTVCARDDVDPDRVGVYGNSLGGAIALNAMAQRPQVRAAVILSAFTSWREIAADAVGGGDPGPVARGLVRLLIRDHRRPDECIAGLDRPIMLVHGDQDGIVPVHHARRLHARQPRAELHILRGAGHNDFRDTHPELDAMIAEFFRRHLGKDE